MVASGGRTRTRPRTAVSLASMILALVALTACDVVRPDGEPLLGARRVVDGTTGDAVPVSDAAG